MAWAVAGLGMGFSYSPLSLVVLREAPLEAQGASTAGLQLSDVLGTALGTGVGGALIAIGAPRGRRRTGSAWPAAFGVGVVAAAIGSAWRDGCRPAPSAARPTAAGPDPAIETAGAPPFVASSSSRGDVTR